MYTVLHSKTVFSGRIIAIVQQEVDIGTGSVKTFEKAVRSPGTRIIIHDKQKQSILITKEYRHELESFDYRLPGGKVVDSLSEYQSIIDSQEDISRLAQEAAIREAKEEVGIISSDCSFFTKNHTGATIERDLYYFILENCIFGPQDLESGEHISYDWYSYDEVLHMCVNGLISEDRSAMVLIRYLNSLEKFSLV